ncbi:hypothetical protein A2917_01320 [Candidatus Nomurabacteria bacterium RIFCSPLOWO2_01_FULL_42_17]|uniref:Uncharacterized protein n=1 Tax=Candidatus Nomurabacteria bacterium RIFCSPLOWO2_01_FULL_42_17 TaxID=1801780 RepID=A0A1F6XLJ5_9BACT|nr:MAG: hypothetical protein A2917_01320 [Candidatus Nomurabacteria bacterium RIFCSPLOWO2_01_FULL_42_17]
MKNNLKNQNRGFLQLIIIIVIALLLMRYFGITISGILDYFHLTWAGILNWFKDLFNSVK